MNTYVGTSFITTVGRYVMMWRQIVGNIIHNLEYQSCSDLRPGTRALLPMYAIPIGSYMWLGKSYLHSLDWDFLHVTLASIRPYRLYI